MRTSSAVTSLFGLLLVSSIVYTFWMHETIMSAPPARPVRVEIRSSVAPLPSRIPSATPSPSSVPSATPSPSIIIPTHTASASPVPPSPSLVVRPIIPQDTYLSWRDVPWDSYPVIETYREVAPVVRTVNPCAENIPHCERISQYVEMSYPAYHVPIPHFANTDDRDFWLRAYAKTFPDQITLTQSCQERGVPLCVKSPELTSTSEGIVFDGDVETEGLVITLIDGKITKDYANKCGNMHRDWDKALRGSSGNSVAEALFLRVPESWSFQHFLDGSFPKFVQWLDFIGPETTLVIEPAAKRFVCDLPNQQNLPSYCNIVESVESAEQLHFGCFAPTMHPYQWRRMQSVVGVRDIPQSARNVIIYATRSGGQVRNHSQRMVMNDDQVRQLLEDHFANRPEELVVYHSNDYSPLENLRLWNSARAVIGPHGGALYNSFFCLPGTVMVEFMDMPRMDSMVVGHLVPYKAATFLGYKYYSMPLLTSSAFNVPLHTLQAILDREFPRIE